MKKRHLVIAVAAVSLMLTGCSDNKSGVGEEADTELTSANFISEITAAQVKAKSSHVEMKIDAAGQKAKAVGDVQIGASAAETKVAMKMDLGSSGAGSFELRLVGGAFYINLGPLSQNKFAKIDLNDKSNPIGSQYGDLLDQLDPSKQLQQFKDAMTSLEKKGEPVELDGVKAQPYEVTLDTTKIESLSELPDGAGSVPKEIVYTMFVGPDNLPRRITTDVAGSAVVMDYSKWGEPVDIKAPSKDQITDKNLMEQPAA